MVSRAQVSIEFLVITGLALAVMGVTSYMIFDYTQQNSDQNAMQQSALVGYRLIDEAANMYVYGQDSFVTVSANLPAQIEAMYVVESDTLVLELNTDDGIVPVTVFSPVPINGTRADPPRSHLDPATSSVRGGSQDFRVTSRGSWVEIRQTT